MLTAASSAWIRRRMNPPADSMSSTTKAWHGERYPAQEIRSRIGPTARRAPEYSFAFIPILMFGRSLPWPRTCGSAFCAYLRCVVRVRPRRRVGVDWARRRAIARRVPAARVSGDAFLQRNSLRARSDARLHSDTDCSEEQRRNCDLGGDRLGLRAPDPADGHHVLPASLIAFALIREWHTRLAPPLPLSPPSRS